MKRFLVSFSGLLVLVFHSCDTKSNKAEPQNVYYIGMTGLDSLKLGMTKAELEAMLHTTFKLQHITVDGGPYDTISTKYKGMDIVIHLYESDEKTVATLYGIQSNDPSCKTAVGIGVGTEKAKVIDSYADYKKYIAPIYETYPERSKTKYVVAVMDSVFNRALLFHIVNRRVSSIEACSYYEFD